MHPTTFRNPPSPDDIVIPTIFLTQGARNSRLLKQSEEIARQLGADEARAVRERDRLDQKRRAVLAELNSNGSDFVYSMKTDAALVDSYVEKAFAGHDSARAARHFYLFRDMKPVKNVQRALEVFFARAGGRAELARVVRRNRVSPAQLARYAATQVYDERALEMVGDFMEEDDDDDERNDRSEKTADEVAEKKREKDGQEKNEWSLPRAMEALGAEIPDSLNLTLKYVHYNTNTGALIRRLQIVLLYFCHRVTRAGFSQFVTVFILCTLDYALNKYERGALVELIGRVSRALVKRAAVIGLSSRELLTPFRSFFARATCRVFGDSAVVTQKTHELHYNFLRNWVVAGAERLSVDKLAAAFLTQRENGDHLENGDCTELGESMSVSVLARFAEDIARADLARSPARIFLCLYRAQLAALFVPALLADALASGLSVEKPQWRALHTKVLEAKDSLQQAVGTLLYMAIEDTPNKVALSKALGETYRAFDHMSVVLDKNSGHFRIDLFYDP